MKEKQNSGFFEYTCTFWDEDEHKIITKKGVIHTITYTEAAAALELYYGQIESMSFEWVDEGEVYEFE